MRSSDRSITRRGFSLSAASLAGLASGLAGRALAQDKAPPGGRIGFDVWRNGEKIGAHTVRFQGKPCAGSATIAARMLVKVGPVPLFHYSHDATETWEGGRFIGLVSRSVTGGKVETVSATRSSEGVRILRSGGAPILAPATALPLTHWNRDALHGPLFNPQTGALVRETVTPVGGDGVRMADGTPVSCSGFRLIGDAEITDWYDANAIWSGLRGKGPDGSTIEYRRTV